MPKLKYEAEDGTLFDTIEDARDYELAVKFQIEYQNAPSQSGTMSVYHLIKNGWQIIPPPAPAEAAPVNPIPTNILRG